MFNNATIIEMKQDRLIKNITISKVFNFKFLTIIFCFISLNAYCMTSQTKVGLTYANLPIAGSTSYWTNDTLANSSDDLYAIPVANLPNSGNYTDYLKITNFQFSIPSGSIISGIIVNVERSDANGKSKDSKVRIIKGGTIGITDKTLNPAWSGTDAVQNYGWNNDKWGETWLASDINSAGFGFAFAAQRTGGGATPTLAKIDQVTITIFYTVPLPIELTLFNAKPVAETVQLSWVTASEINNDFFTIEKSNDGINFFELKKIQGAGNSNVSNSYHVIDDNLFFQTSYYRLKQTDYDGTSSTFETISISMKEKQNSSSAILVYPNAFKESFTAQFEMNENKTIQIQIINMNGELVFIQNFHTIIGTNFYQFNANQTLRKGSYILRINNETELNSTSILYN